MEPILEKLKFFGCDKPEQYSTNILVQSWVGIHMFYAIAQSFIQAWQNAQIQASKGSLRNSRGAGRSRCDIGVIFLCIVIKAALGSSILDISKRIRNDNFIRAVLFSLLNRKVDDDKLPSRSTLQKYQSELGFDNVIDDIYYEYTKLVIQYASVSEHTDTLHTGLEDVKFGELGAIDASFIDLDITHLSKEDYNNLKAGNISEVVGKLPFNSEKAKRLFATWGAKYGKYFHGLKMHILTEAKTNIIIGFTITPAHINDTVELLPLVTQAKSFISGMEVLVADSIYNTKSNHEELSRQFDMKLEATSKKGKKEERSQNEIESNKQIGRKRCFVEHCFSFIKRVMGLKPDSIEETTVIQDCKLAICLANAHYFHRCLDGRKGGTMVC